MDQLCRFIALIGSEALVNPSEVHPERIYPHPWLQEWTYTPTPSIPTHLLESWRELSTEDRNRAFYQWRRDNPKKLIPLDAELGSFIEKLEGQENKTRHPFDRIDGYRIFLRLRELTGLPESWGICPVCEGSGMDPDSKEAFESWCKTHPPDGPGYQLWETTTEGSPISPVFPDEDSFVSYLVAEGYSENAARDFTQSGWIFSAVQIGGQVKANIHAFDVIRAKD